MDEDVVFGALNSEFKILKTHYRTILQNKIEKFTVLTRNVKDYKKSELAILIPETYVKEKPLANKELKAS